LEGHQSRDQTAAVGQKILRAVERETFGTILHPAIERLPHGIGEEFPDSNLLMVYFPSTSNREQSSEEAGASPREEAGASPLSGSKDYRETEQARPVAQEDTLGPGALRKML